MNNLYKDDVEFFAGVHVRKVDPLVLEELKNNEAVSYTHLTLPTMS